MHDTCPTPAFTSKSRDSVVSLDCGSPWAVDLTADADCNREGVERCHPRLTLGWQRQEVLLSMPSDPLPTAEYVQAYCDLWRRGRHENVLVAPVEQDEARSRAQRDRKRLFSARSAASGGLDVLVLVLRGLSLEHSRRALTRTLGHLRQLNASGQYTLATAERFRALSSNGAASLRVLLQGSAVADSEHEEPWPTLWDTYRQWGYVSMFGEAGCGTAVMRPLGYSLEAPPPADHVLVEPFCTLDAQLRDRLQSAAAMSEGTEGGGAEPCVGQAPAWQHLLNYTRRFLRAYPSVPKLAVAAFPAPPQGSDAGWPHKAADLWLRRTLRSVLRRQPRTAVVILSDTGASEDRALTLTLTLP